MKYAGDVTSEKAWRALQQDPAAVLVDVRTRAEWIFVGTPDLSAAGKEVVQIEWQSFPGMAVNEEFVAAVESRGATPESKLYFICRSGIRSRDAAIAMTAAGYAQCCNVADGFEGDLDGNKHRGATGGWKAAGLPWSQS